MEASGTLDELIDGAEELLTRLADNENPEIQHLRDRVDQAIEEARHGFATRGGHTSIRLRDVANTIDDYVRDYPWLAVTTGVLVAGAFGFIAGSLAGEKKTVPQG